MVYSRRPKRVGGAPSPAPGFFGRDRELEDISALLLTPARMITLVGVGGIGKTRLAAETVNRFRNQARVCWVRLSRLAAGSDVVTVAEEAAHTVVPSDYSGRTAEEALVDTFTRVDSNGRVPRTILVLDNCEHVLAGAARLSADLLDSIPGLTILATSREALGWSDEHLITVPPLPHRHALTLFRYRAELTGRTISGADEPTATAICRRINNHPLYIQLAAARLRYQPLTMVLQGLTGHDDDARLHWSRGPAEGTESRHRAVTDVIAWSYNLCSDKERLLFDRLSVFAAGYAANPEDIDGDGFRDGGASLDAIQEICADDSYACDENSALGVGSNSDVTLERREIERLLERLVDKSLVSVHMTPSTVRYSMLESLRVFAQQRLRKRSTAAIDEPSRLAGQHRRYYRDKVVNAAATWLGPAEHDLLAETRAAWDNILTAIETSIDTPEEAVIGLEICTALLTLRLPLFTGSFREMRLWTERALRASRGLTPQTAELRIGAMALLVWVTLCQGESYDAEALLGDCIFTSLRETGSGSVCTPAEPETDVGLPAAVELAWGTELLLARSDARAVTVLGRARRKFSETGDPRGEAMSRAFEVLAACLLGPPEQALKLSHDSLERATASGAAWLTSWAHMSWSIALTKNGDPTEALLFQRRALTYLLSAGDPWTSLWAAQLRAWSLARMIDDSITDSSTSRAQLVAWATEIAQLSGGLEVQREVIGIHIEKLRPFATESAKAIVTAQKILGSEAYAEAKAQGARLRPESNEVQHLALGTYTISRSDAVETRSLWHQLTRAEREVAVLAAAGWSNRAIATRRGKSTRTIDSQLASVLRKLAISSRDDIIGHIPKDTIARVRSEYTAASSGNVR
ncbi:LuxR C-terminal-related transcriptional regulator [Nocardia wallacei]|uniref:LuxR C-terminal-related transcriptional regulator n=1 Tax=Nocardia wallacei TaxID=480035 RepID=UPI002454D23E|nr:LuxR C-terminal-related transcriptional regulator [Nocardia wallacei]